MSRSFPMSARNRQIRLKSRPVGIPTPDVWSRTEEPLREPRDGEFLVKVLYISLDPSMRVWMDTRKSHTTPVALGDVMRAIAVGRVVASRTERFAVAEHVLGTFGVQEYAMSDGSGVARVDTSLAPLPAYLGVLGVTGMTAYFGLLDVGQPKPGDTVVVSGAAGAVGTIAGQIARIKGCRVVGIAGGAEKCKYVVEELGFDHAIDYKHEDVQEALAKACPRGVDVYFDNVGGDILDAVLARLARGARVVICGAISQYNNSGPFRGPDNYWSLLLRSAHMGGFLLTDYATRYGEAWRELAGWLAAGQLRSREQVVEGLDAFPDTLLKLFRGENTGKLLLKVAED
jgi:hypothetical protein